MDYSNTPSGPTNVIQSTAGAIPVVNEKGEVTMQKVKVQRYISGRKPKYACDESSDEESGDEGLPFTKKKQEMPIEIPMVSEEVEKADPRLRRLQRALDLEEEEEDEDRLYRHRVIHEPEVVSVEELPIQEEEEMKKEMVWAEEEESSEEELDDEEIAKRREILRKKALQTQDEPEEIMELTEEAIKSEAELSEESEYDEYTDTEEEGEGQRLKPIFVRKQDRVTIEDQTKITQKEKEKLQEAKRLAEERRRTTLKMVEDDAKREIAENTNPDEKINEVCTDDENEEAAYESWKLRELKRIKRDKEEKERIIKEKMDTLRSHNMTDEERRAEIRNNPRIITNKSTKGKYKFLQKYYHRGAFYLNEDEDVLKRDFTASTLEDHFDKTILPKVMQVKNFGRSGRTKYTHLVDQDTTQFDSPWMAETTQNLKFHTQQSSSSKQVFARPSYQKNKK